MLKFDDSSINTFDVIDSCESLSTVHLCRSRCPNVLLVL